MLVLPRCNLNFQNCTECPEEMDDFVDAVVGVLDDLEDELKDTPYKVVPLHTYHYDVTFECGGECMCRCDYYGGIVYVEKWSC